MCSGAATALDLNEGRNPTNALQTYELLTRKSPAHWPGWWISSQVGSVYGRLESPAVPRFHFNVREGTRFTEDEEGLEFPDLDTAEREAAEAAAEVARDRLPRSDARDVTVEVLNEDHQRLITVTITMEIHRVSPSPQPRA